LKALETVKSVFFYLMAASRVAKTLGFLFRSEIEHRKRLFIKSFLFYVAGGAFFIGGILSLGHLTYLLLERYFHDPILSTSIVGLSFFIIGSLSLYVGDRILTRLLSIDWEKVKKSIM